MLIPNKLNTIIRILLANHFEKKPNLQFSTLAKKAHVSAAMAKRLLIRLKDSEYVNFSRGIKVVNPIKLMAAWGYAYSVRELERIEFIAAERPQYVMMKIAGLARNNRLEYAFTLFSATEHVSPYVGPSETFLYILKKDVNVWQNAFKGLNILPAEGSGNVVCLLVDEDYFEGIWEARDAKVVSIPQLYADLFSYGGRGEEAAKEILNRYCPHV
ncbi:MAG TPA: type IV toxin-antitoxin system AbiEi family antitoxin [Candidatus Nanoarchaeia archaeon]|nr:type IV toxin-antitoxin system AbiEi family antitoxin [Candidatus Nanoarchaeia archaeon]